jgi:hypothetical protein
MPVSSRPLTPSPTSTWTRPARSVMTVRIIWFYSQVQAGSSPITWPSTPYARRCAGRIGRVHPGIFLGWARRIRARPGPGPRRGSRGPRRPAGVDSDVLGHGSASGWGLRRPREAAAGYRGTPRSRAVARRRTGPDRSRDGARPWPPSGPRRDDGRWRTSDGKIDQLLRVAPLFERLDDLVEGPNQLRRLFSIP